jgi:hypothetical protein
MVKSERLRPKAVPKFYHVLTRGIGLLFSRPADHISALQGETNSTAAIELAKSWIHRCLQEHTVCGKSTDGWLPTRLIEVGSEEQEPRLRITSGM